MPGRPRSSPKIRINGWQPGYPQALLIIVLYWSRHGMPFRPDECSRGLQTVSQELESAPSPAPFRTPQARLSQVAQAVGKASGYCSGSSSHGGSHHCGSYSGSIEAPTEGWGNDGDVGPGIRTCDFCCAYSQEAAATSSKVPGAPEYACVLSIAYYVSLQG